MVPVSKQLPEIEILTPLYDPSGEGLDLFMNTVAAVLLQRGVEWHWTISIQEVGHEYRPLLATLVNDPRVSISLRPHVLSLSEHLNSMFEAVGFGKVHLLCHDDFYTRANSLAEIVAGLDRYDLLHIEPVVRVVSEQGIGSSIDKVGEFQLRDERNWVLLREHIGINTLGGLTATAWKSHKRLESLEHDLFADLELREAIRKNSTGTGLLIGGAITQHSWPGQAQHWQSKRIVQEAGSWVANRGNESRSRNILYATISVLQGPDALALAWSSVVRPLWVKHLLDAVCQGQRTFAGILRRLRAFLT